MMTNKKAEIVLVDDDAMVRSVLSAALSGLYTVHAYAEPREAKRLLESRHIPLVLLDLNLPGVSGIETLKEWRLQFPETEIVFCSGETRVDRAIECLRLGASDFIVKPINKADLLLIVQRTLEKHELKKRAEKLKPLLHPRPIEFIGSSPAIQEVLAKVKLLRGQTHLNVILLGESGTGKEILARLLHQQEVEDTRPFVVVNMPAIPTNLMEAELFGVEKGAYTDAKASRAGKFELADGGDIFLDEIGDLPVETQAKLLRTLQEKQIERIGENRTRKVNFRVISATNQPLSELMNSGKFREDVIYRLSDMVLWLPPLRERLSDLPILAEHMIRKYARGSTLPKLSETALKTLMEYHWPGNVRQLESTIKRALIFTQSSVIEKIEIYDPSMFNPNRLSANAGMPQEANGSCFETLTADYERKLLQTTIARCNGDNNAAMLALKLPRATFYRKLTQLGLSQI